MSQNSRRNFIVGCSSLAAFAFSPTLPSSNWSASLPTIDGGTINVSPARTNTLLREARAAYTYHGMQQQQYYAALYHQQQLQMMAYRAAYERWATHQAWQQQMAAYSWATEQHRRSLARFMTLHRQYAYAGSAQPYDHIESVYAVGTRPGGTPVLFGANRSGGRVTTSQRTLRGAAAVYDEASKHRGEASAQRVALPQTSERNTQITLPQGNRVRGKGFRSSTGAVAISDEEFVASNGKVGPLVKFVEAEGESWMVI